MSGEGSRRPVFEPAQEYTPPPPPDVPEVVRSRRRSPMIAGVALVSALAGTLWFLMPGTTPRRPFLPGPAATPPIAPTGPAYATVSPSGDVLILPLLFPVVSAAAPAGTRSEGPPAVDLGDQSYVWGGYDGSRARALQVTVTRHDSGDNARDALASDRSVCAGTNRPACGGFLPP